MGDQLDYTTLLGLAGGVLWRDLSAFMAFSEDPVDIKKKTWKLKLVKQIQTVIADVTTPNLCWTAPTFISAGPRLGHWLLVAGNRSWQKQLVNPNKDNDTQEQNGIQYGSTSQTVLGHHLITQESWTMQTVSQSGWPKASCRSSPSWTKSVHWYRQSHNFSVLISFPRHSPMILDSHLP